MGALKPLEEKPVSLKGAVDTDRLALYDTYGSLAYGVILQIIPQQEVAQEVLVNLFTSPQLNQCVESPATTSCAIIRLARQQALEASRSLPSFSAQLPIEKNNLPKTIFDLSFRQGYEPRIIAEQLQIPYAEVIKSIRDYFKYLRTS